MSHEQDLRFQTPHLSHICHILYLGGGLKPAAFLLFWPETCSFGRFSCIFHAVLKLEPLTFNPSVQGSNP